MALFHVVAGVGLAIVVVGLARMYDDELGANPVMDEVFHVPQARQYCRWAASPSFSKPLPEHDPKVTTFPGIYILSGLAWAAVRSITGACCCCSVAFLRSVNPALALVGARLSHELCVVQGGRANRRSSAVDAVVDAALATTFPLHFFFIFLYYTDTASTVFVLATWLALTKERYALSGILGGCSILMRQTNAVWMVCLVGWDVVDHAVAASMAASTSESSKTAKAIRTPGDVVRSTIRYVWAERSTCVRRYGLHALSALAFAAFVVHNGAVVIGDRANHVPVRHWVQPFYFYLFLVLSTLPLWAGRGWVAFRHRRRRDDHDHDLPVPPPLLLLPLPVLLLLAAALLAVDRGTLVHPFMLADNRHYTFYLWRRFIGASDLSRYYFVPLYALSARMATATQDGESPSGRAGSGGAAASAAAASTVKTGLLAACTAAVLVPAHLVEFRYFTVPWFLHMLRPGSVLYVDAAGRPPAMALKLVTLVGYLALNAVTVYVFLHRSFTWGDGTVGRFMW